MASKSLPLHCSVLGDNSPGGWVLLLHGLFGSGDNLGTLGRALAETHRVALLDLRNHGRSPHSDAMDLPLLAADIVAVQDALGIDSAALVGHSLGGKVAMQLAMSDPARVSRLVVLDIAPVAYPPAHRDIFQALHSVDLRGLASRRDIDVQLAHYVKEAPVRQFLLKSLDRGDDGWHWRFNWPVLESRYPGLSAAPAGQPYTGPALFLKGEQSPYILDAYRPALAAAFPHYRLEVIAGTGHWLHGERPVAVNELVQDFLR